MATGLYLVPWFENRSAWTEAMAGARGIEQTTWNSINHAKKRPERVQMRECIPAVCLCSACSQLQRPASSRHSHMLEKSLGLLSLLLVLINAHRPLTEVSLTGHTHDRAPSARARTARAPRPAAPRARRPRGGAARAPHRHDSRHWGQIIDRLLS